MASFTNNSTIDVADQSECPSPQISKASINWDGTDAVRIVVLLDQRDVVD